MMKGLQEQYGTATFRRQQNMAMTRLLLCSTITITLPLPLYLIQLRLPFHILFLWTLHMYYPTPLHIVFNAITRNTTKSKAICCNARFCTLLTWTRNWNILMLLLYTIPYEYLMSKTSQNIQRRGPWATEKLKYDPNSNWLSYARFWTLLPYHAELKPLTLPLYTISDWK